MFAWPQRTPDILDTLNCRELSDSLKYVASTLETLDLSFGNTRQPNVVHRSGFQGINDRLGSLHNFKKLRSIAIPITLMSGDLNTNHRLMDCLPPTLRKICLTDDLCDLEVDDRSGYLKPWIEEFLKGGGMQGLRSLTIEHRTWKEVPVTEADMECHAVSGVWQKGQPLQWAEEDRYAFKQRVT